MAGPEKEIQRGTLARTRSSRATHQKAIEQKAIAQVQRATSDKAVEDRSTAGALRLDKPLRAESEPAPGLLRSLFDRIFLVDQLRHVEFRGGVTWGVPVRTDAHVRAEVTRSAPPKDVLIVRVIKTLRVGVDSGYGASLYVGTKNVGGGVDAGVNAEAGALSTLIEEYELPVDDVFAAFVTFVTDQTLLLLFARPETAPIGQVLDSYLASYSERHLVRKKVETGPYARADAEASLGLRRPADDVKQRATEGEWVSGHEVWRSSDEHQQQGSRPRLINPSLEEMVGPSDKTLLESLHFDPLALLSFLNIRFNALVAGQALFGVEHRPRENSVRAFVEGELNVVAGIPIPLLTQALQLLPRGFGVGFEITFKYVEEKLDKVLLAVYQFHGEDEFLAGTANQETFYFEPSDVLAVGDILQALVSGVPVGIAGANLLASIDKCTFWNRFGIHGVMGSHFRGLMRRQRGVRSLLANELTGRSTVFGGTLEAYVDLGIELTGPELLRLVEIFIESLPEKGGPKPPEGLDPTGYVRYFGEFVRDYGERLAANSGPVVEFARSAIQVDEAEFMISIAPGMGAAGKIAAGAKARLDVSGEVGAGCRLRLPKGRLGDILDHLDDVLERPLKHMPQCRIVQLLMRAFGEGRDGDVEETAQRASGSPRDSPGTVIADESRSLGGPSDDYVASVLFWMEQFPGWGDVKPGNYAIRYFVSPGEEPAPLDGKKPPSGVISVFVAGRLTDRVGGATRIGAIVEGEMGTEAGKPVLRPRGEMRFVTSEGEDYQSSTATLPVR